jgi:hypothetical protein
VGDGLKPAFAFAFVILFWISSIVPLSVIVASRNQLFSGKLNDQSFSWASSSGLFLNNHVVNSKSSAEQENAYVGEENGKADPTKTFYSKASDGYLVGKGPGQGNKKSRRDGGSGGNQGSGQSNANKDQGMGKGKGKNKQGR